MLASFMTETLAPDVIHPLAGSPAELVWVLPLLPLVGAVILGVLSIWSARTHGDRDAAPSGARWWLPTLLGPGSVLLAFGVALSQLRGMLTVGTEALTAAGPFVRDYGVWMAVDQLIIRWGLQLDALSMLMTLVITGVGFLIHVFSIGYMGKDPGYVRYFAYLNLFVAAMLVLVLGSSYPVLFVGWEGVGLASYLLIGFWYTDGAKADAGRKAFVVNRIGDFGLLAGMFFLARATGSLDFVAAHSQATLLPAGIVLIIALLFVLGGVGKSAQLPLYLWLPDAMAGPTPVSALIHAATMVTAGVYLIARASVLFAAALPASLLITLIGSVTALFAATIALRQWDIKRVLAYSTVSQLGFMFMGVGVGAYSAGIFHLVTHAFFKALLFLGAGAVIHAMHDALHGTGSHADPQDLRNMGGLRQRLPIIATVMMIATAAIAGIPPLSGFFSKDEILTATFAGALGSPLAAASLFGVQGTTVLYVAYVLGLVTAVLTAVYMTRMALLTFGGAPRHSAETRAALHDASAVMAIPLIVLALLAMVGGALNLPAFLPGVPSHLLEDFLSPVLAASTARMAPSAALDHAVEMRLVAVAIAASVLGIAFAVWRYRISESNAEALGKSTALGRWLEQGYFVDRFVTLAIVRPYLAIADRWLVRGVDRVVHDGLVDGATALAVTAQRVHRKTGSGDIGRYAWLFVMGAIGVMALLALLVTRV
jgi:NADH-quinone oxidoreductase subunit L